MVVMAAEPDASDRGLTVVLSGAECAGKTTLAQTLAAAFSVPWLDEYARHYLAERSSYVEEDLVRIAQGQHRAERELTRSHPLVMVDTDVLVVCQWADVKYGRRAAALDALVMQTLAALRRRLYLVPVPDIPWQPDPLREHPHERMALHDRHLTLLRGLGVEFHELSGSQAQRLAAAISLVAAQIPSI
jgi:nicotinamide riboside kinase